jgi:cytochrome c oxidase subunit I+III
MESAAATATGTARGREALVRAWRRPPGFVGWLAAVNHKNIGWRFIVTGLAFFVAGGILALLMRTQLASSESGFLSAQAFNDAFTMHGTTMMFLFAVPILEGIGMYMLPLLLGTRDLPFPRLNAFGYWAYLFGGLFVYASFVTGTVPDAGWFAYVPLSGPIFSPAAGMDFWLLGITLVEISGIIGALELVVLFLSRRAPGMAINRIPVFAWAVFVMAAMIVVAFPVLATATVLLEIERVFGTNFYDPAGGGSALLWQHLFWFFGHPEVYIMLIPAVGIVSAVVPVFSRRRLAGYPFVVAALVAIGLLSFALWVHHMFTTGLALGALSAFAITSFLIAIPSGIQVFAWLVTMWRGKPAFRTPLLFVLGFVFIFVVGGITGVMVAAVPFDWQVHDSYFVVAHFHYVLIGGVVFPIFGGLYYWFPKWTGRMLGERLGQASFWTMLVGFNLAFFPQHFLGFEGMPRRVFTYRAAEGWDLLNLLSTLGTYVLAIGIAFTLVNLLLSAWRGAASGPNPWGAGTLEWAASSPPEPYNFQELPVVEDPDPLWVSPGEASERTRQTVRELAEPRRNVREVFETTGIEARPVGVARLPGPTLAPLAATIALGAGLVGALASLPWLAIAGLAVAVGIAVGVVAGAPPDVPVGVAGRELAVRRAGAGWWGGLVACVILGAVAGALIFAYLYLAIEAEAWPPAGISNPPLAPALAGGLGAVLAYLLVRIGARGAGRMAALLLGAGALVCVEVAVATGVWLGNVDANPTETSYGSTVFALLGFEIALAASVAVAAAVTIWRLVAGTVDPQERIAPRVVETLTAFMAASWLLVAALVYVVPRVG